MDARAWLLFGEGCGLYGWEMKTSGLTQSAFERKVDGLLKGGIKSNGLEGDMTKYRVSYYESEKGWGCDSWTVDYDSEEEARAAYQECFDKYMKSNATPDYYVRPSYVGEIK